MSNVELLHTVREYREYQQIKEAAEARLEELKAVITSVMGNEDEITIDVFRVRNKLISSSRLDAYALKNELPDIAARYTKENQYRRFSVA